MNDETREIRGYACTVLFGEAVRKERMLRKWSASKLAREADLATDTVIAAENAVKAPGINTQQAIADALGVDLHDLIPTGHQISRKASQLKKTQNKRFVHMPPDQQELPLAVGH